MTTTGERQTKPSHRDRFHEPQSQATGRREQGTGLPSSELLLPAELICGSITSVLNFLLTVRAKGARLLNPNHS